MKQIKVENYRQKERATQIYAGDLSGEGGYASKLKLLALFLRDECSMTSAQIEAYILSFCEKHIPNYHFRAFYQAIGGAVKYAGNPQNVLIQVESLPVYDTELEYIQSMDLPHDQKKLVFSLLMLKKLDRECYHQRHDGEYKMGYFSMTDERVRFLKKTSTLPNKTDICKDAFYQWQKAGLVQVAPAGLILTFMDKMPTEGIEVIRVTHFDCMGAYWDVLFDGDKMTKCEACGRPIRKTRQDRRYCKEHEGWRMPVEIHKTKQIKCEVCGKMFYASSHAVKARVCPPCSRENRKQEF